MGRTAVLGGKVLSSATSVFRKAGYADASMDEIAAEAGISKATLYRYYPSKQSLFAAVLGELLVAQFDPPVSLGANPAATLRALGKRILGTLNDPAYQDLLRVTLAERSRFPELTAALWDRVIGRGARLMTALFAREVSSGAMRSLDPGVAAQEFIGMLLAASLTRTFASRLSQKDPARIVRQAVDVFLTGSLKETYKQKRAGGRAGSSQPR